MQEKPSILFFISHFRYGGAEASLAALLPDICRDFNVSILTDITDSPYLNIVLSASKGKINVIHKKYIKQRQLLTFDSLISSLRLCVAIAKSSYTYFIPLFLNNSYLSLVFKIFAPATKIFIWEHTLISRHYKNQRFLLVWAYLADGIFLPSDYSYRDFKKICPRLALKVKIVPNPCRLNPDSTRLAKYSKSYGLETVNLVFIGRLSSEKNPDKAVRCLKLLVSSGLSSRLHFFGQGSLYHELHRIASDLNILELISFYPFSRNVWDLIPPNSIVLVLSAYESFSMVALESLCLSYHTIITADSFSDSFHSPSLHVVSSDDVEEIVSTILQVSSLMVLTKLPQFNRQIYNQHRPDLVARRFAQSLV